MPKPPQNHSAIGFMPAHYITHTFIFQVYPFIIL